MEQGWRLARSSSEIRSLRLYFGSVGDRTPVFPETRPTSRYQIGGSDTNHIHQLGYHGDRTLVLGLQLDRPEFGVVGLEHDT